MSMKSFVNKYQLAIFFSAMSAMSILVELWWQWYEMDHPHYWVIAATSVFGFASVLSCMVANIKARRMA